MTEMKKVLLIDDDADFVTIHTRMLERAGYEVIAAYSGEEGMREARAKKPDVIVLDVIMTTSTEGFEVARKLREDALTQHTPIVMLTAINTPDYRLPRALGDYDRDETWNPVDVFLNKPVSPEDLLQQVDELAKVQRPSLG